MNIPIRWCQYLSRIVMRAPSSRPPDFIIGGADAPYLRRWFLIPRNSACNAYLHEFLRDDDDRALHDHPWPSLSILLSGALTEHTIAAGGVHKEQAIAAGDVRFRSARFAHRLSLPDGPAWTLFLTGPRIRHWGFHTRHRWVYWRDFVDPDDPGLQRPEQSYD